MINDKELFKLYFNLLVKLYMVHFLNFNILFMYKLEVTLSTDVIVRAVIEKRKLLLLFSNFLLICISLILSWKNINDNNEKIKHCITGKYVNLSVITFPK